MGMVSTSEISEKKLPNKNKNIFAEKKFRGSLRRILVALIVAIALIVTTWFLYITFFLKTTPVVDHSGIANTIRQYSTPVSNKDRASVLSSINNVKQQETAGQTKVEKQLSQQSNQNEKQLILQSMGR